jgi:hypothetical protein
MPFSSHSGKEFIKSLDLNAKTVLDVGAGCGTYRSMFSTLGKHWTALEVWQPYVDKYDLRKKYDEVIVEDLRTWQPNQKYDICFCGDILEHMTEKEAVQVLNKLREISTTVIVSIPIGHYPQDEYEGNPYEIHVEDHWTHDRFISSFGKPYQFHLEKEIGVYLFKKGNEGEEWMNFNVINLAHRQDRWKHITETFSAFPLKRFNALTHPEGGWVGCLKSHGALLKQLVEQDKNNVGMYAVLEDDCELLIPQEVFESKWEKYKKYLSEHMGEWDFFSGGGIYVRPIRIVCHDPFIIECDWSVAIHFTVHTKRSAQTMIDFAAQTKWDTSCDNHLSENHRGRIWLPYPMMCGWIRSASDISEEYQDKCSLEFDASAKTLEEFVKAEKAKTIPKPSTNFPFTKEANSMQNIDLSTVLSRHIIWTEGKLEAFKEVSMYVNATGTNAPMPPAAPVKPQVALTVQVPNLTLFTNFLSPKECQEVIDQASNSLQKSKVIGEGDDCVYHESRTNLGTFLNNGSSPVVDRICEHISILTGIPVEYGEPMQISRYEVGEEYKPHYDHFEEDNRSSGQRVATFLIYLNTPEDGGETTFPDAKIDVQAVMGNAILFRYPKANSSELTLHGGTPVKAGVKWIAVKWLRDRAFG